MSPTDNTRGVDESFANVSSSPNTFASGNSTPNVFARSDDDPVARKRVFPLTSFEDTPQNVACISFLLGALFCVGSITLIFGPAASTSPILVAATQPKLGAYAACWALFHLLEYVVTAIYNPTRVKVSCASPSPTTWMRTELERQPFSSTMAKHITSHTASVSSSSSSARLSSPTTCARSSTCLGSL